ncbi:MAG: GNAT family N-acetyltransferase [Oscillospiraceae bacterium]
MGYEIRNCNSSDIAGLKLLWAEVFHDDNQYIDHFFESIFSINNAFVAVDGNVPVAMMFMLPATLTVGKDAFLAGYIYAVATNKSYRGQGVMTKLERYVCQKAALSDVSVLALVPSNKSLIKMYKKLGYQTAFYKASTIIIPKVCDNAEILNCTLDCFLEQRKNMLTQYETYFELDAACRRYRYETLKDNGEILLYKDDVDDGYIVGQKNGNNYLILETSLPIGALAKAAFAISEKYYKLKKISLVGKNGTLTPYGMLKTLDSRVNIFGIIKSNPYMNLMLE